MLRQDLITLAFTRGNARLWELSRLWQVRLPLLTYSVALVLVRQLLLHRQQKAHTTLKKSSGRTCWKWRPFPRR